MKRSLVFASITSIFALLGPELVACSSSSSTPAADAGSDGSTSDSGPGADSAAPPDSSVQADAGDAAVTDGGQDGAASDAAVADGGADSSAGDGGCTGTNSVALTVANFKAWCSLTVAGTAIAPGTLGTTTMTTVCVAPGATLSATANGAAFEIGDPPSPFISGTGTVTDSAGTASTTLTAGATCVFACCPFADSDAATGGCAGLVNPCP